MPLRAVDSHGEARVLGRALDSHGTSSEVAGKLANSWQMLFLTEDTSGAKAKRVLIYRRFNGGP
jgi:hypothetical protein